MFSVIRPRVAALLLAPVFVVGCGESEPASDGEAAEAEAVAVLASGTTLTLELSETISTSSHASGDPVTATVTEGVTGPDGSVVVPAGAEMKGAVARAERSEGPNDPAVLSFHFRTLEVGGTSYPVAVTVQEAEPRRTEGDSDVESVAKVAIGTAAGALVGQVLGGGKETTLGGAAAGTLAGAAVAIMSQHGHATLRAGSRIVVEVQERVRLD